MKAPQALLAAIEAAFNRYLALDPAALRRVGQLEGRVIAIELTGLDLCLFLLPGPRGVQVLSQYEGEPDARLTGTPLALMRMGLSDDASRQLFAHEVEIRGDIELGQQFKHILDAIEIDWEEQLSRVSGDVAAHQIGRAARGLAGWGRQTADSLTRDLGEYLQEEARLVPSGAEVQRYLAEVDTLRADVDRLEARVQRLKGRLAPEPGPGDTPR